MEPSEYMKIAESIPNEWYTAAEAKEISAGIFYDIMIGSAMRSGLVINDDQDLQKLLESISKERNVPVDEVLNDIKNISLTVGAIKLFNRKYTDIAELFPKDEYGNPDYPPDFLAKILGVEDPDIADMLKSGVLKDYSIYLQDAPNDSIQ